MSQKALLCRHMEERLAEHRKDATVATAFGLTFLVALATVLLVVVDSYQSVGPDAATALLSLLGFFIPTSLVRHCYAQHKDCVEAIRTGRRLKEYYESAFDPPPPPKRFLPEAERLMREYLYPTE